MGDAPYARPAVDAAGGRGGFSGLNGRRRDDSDARFHHNVHAAVTAATAATVTADNVMAVTAIAVTTITVTTVTAFTSTAGNVTAVISAVLGAVADVWPYPLEDGLGSRHADDTFLGNAGNAASLAASEKRRGFQSQRWTPVQDGVAVDAGYAWSGGC